MSHLSIDFWTFPSIENPLRNPLTFPTNLMENLMDFSNAYWIGTLSGRAGETNPCRIMRKNGKNGRDRDWGNGRKTCEFSRICNRGKNSSSSKVLLPPPRYEYDATPQVVRRTGNPSWSRLRFFCLRWCREHLYCQKRQLTRIERKRYDRRA